MFCTWPHIFLSSVNNKKIQDTLRQEIGFYESRLEVLYNELANLKSSFDIYQRLVST